MNESKFSAENKPFLRNILKLNVWLITYYTKKGFTWNEAFSQCHKTLKHYLMFESSAKQEQNEVEQSLNSVFLVSTC